MYGTIGRFRIKAGMEAQFRQLMDEQAHAVEHGQIFENREAYLANAESPEMDARYHQWLPLLERGPQWHDGEIVNVMR